MQAQFKKALSRFATGVCVMTFVDAGSQLPEGVTISAFSSLSLSPLSILFCLGNQGRNYAAFRRINRFAVNILSNRHKALAYQFASSDRDGLKGHFGEKDGLPVIKHCLATLVCDKGNMHPEGDHDIIIGHVRSIELGDDKAQPLLYYKSSLIEDYQYE